MSTITSTHPCALAAHGLCTETTTRDKLMCLDHWREVPAPLQRAVNDAFRAFGQSSKHNIRERLKALRVAQVEATNAVVQALREKGAES